MNNDINNPVYNPDCVVDRPRNIYTTNPDALTQPTEANKAKRIEITPLDRGYHVTVGCQTFAIESTDMLIAKLSSYLRSPLSIEAKWMKEKQF